jgi:hypothetical protein
VADEIRQEHEGAFENRDEMLLVRKTRRMAASSATRF